MTRRITTFLVPVALLSLAACGGSDDTSSSSTTAGSPTSTSSSLSTSSGSSSTAATTTTAAGTPETSAPSTTEGCGVTLADVQAVLPPGTGVGQNDTPDPFRCNFIWTDGGDWGIDVAVVKGGRQDFEGGDFAPDDGSTLKNGTPYQSVPGLGDVAYSFTTEQGTNFVVLVGADLVVADIVHSADATGNPGDQTAIVTALATKATASL